MAVDFLNPGVQTTGAAASDEQNTFSWGDSFQRYSYWGLLGLTALLIYSFWNMFELTADAWAKPQYSHGYIIPLIALYLMWSRRPNPEAQEPPRGQAEATFMDVMPASQFFQATVAAGGGLSALGWFMTNDLLQGVGWTILTLGGLAYVLIGQPFQKVTDSARYTGAAVLLGAYALRILYAAEYEIEPLNRLSFVIALLGVFLLVGGWSMMRWAGVCIGFLLFMYPLPTIIEMPLLGSLQKFAAVCSEIVLVILGQPVTREGAVILVDGIPLTVAEACSGMRMVTIFTGLAVAMVMLSKRPWWDRFTVLLSAIPIAVFVNILRIVVIALAYRFVDDDFAHRAAHDLAGLAMMVPALGLLYLEQWVLARLTVPEEGIASQGIGMGAGPVPVR